MDLESSPRTSPSLLLAVRDPTDGRAWAAFVGRYDEPIRRWCRSMGLGPEAQDEVTQRILVKLLNRMQTFRYDPEKQFRAWLRAVVKNEAATYRRNARPGHGSCLDNLPDPDGVDGEEMRDRDRGESSKGSAAPRGLRAGPGPRRGPYLAGILADGGRGHHGQGRRRRDWR